MTEQDKQALIKHFCLRDCGEAAEGCKIMPCHEIELIQEFPTTEADTDTISRQAAIMDAESWVAVDEYEKHLKKNVVEWLKEFPPAEPEIIECDPVKACYEATMNKVFSAYRYLSMLEDLKVYGYVLAKRRTK